MKNPISTFRALEWITIASLFIWIAFLGWFIYMDLDYNLRTYRADGVEKTLGPVKIVSYLVTIWVGFYFGDSLTEKGVRPIHIVVVIALLATMTISTFATDVIARRIDPNDTSAATVPMMEFFAPYFSATMGAIATLVVKSKKHKREGNEPGSNH